MTSPIQKLIDQACLVPTPEGQETFHAWPCPFCGKDGDQRGICCKGWVRLTCATCGETCEAPREPEDPEGDEVVTEGCPNCEPSV